MPEARRRTEALLAQAGRHFAVRIPAPEVRFDLRGKAAGQVRQVQGRVWQVRYNVVLLAREPEAFLAQTVPHECAHLVAFALFGRGIRPSRAGVAGGHAPLRCRAQALSQLPGGRPAHPTPAPLRLPLRLSHPSAHQYPALSRPGRADLLLRRLPWFPRTRAHRPRRPRDSCDRPASDGGTAQQVASAASAPALSGRVRVTSARPLRRLPPGNCQRRCG